MKNKSDLLLETDETSSGWVKTEKLVFYSFLFLLFSISTSYFLWFGNGLLYYQENQSLFIFSSDYFQEFISKPGGLLFYAGNFLTQFYFSSFYGALIISALLILLCLTYNQILRLLSAPKLFSMLFTLLPSCFLLLLQSQYDVFILHSLGYLLVALWFLISIILTKKNFYISTLFLFPFLFYLAGSFSFIYLGTSIIFFITYEKGNRRYILSLSLLTLALTTFIIFKELLFLQPVDRLLAYPLFLISSSETILFLSLFSIFIILIPLLTKYAGLFQLKNKLRNIIPIASCLALFPVIIFCLYYLYKPDVANLMKLEKSVHNQDWDVVVRQSQKFPSTNIIGQYYYNLALSEKGQLCDRLFFCPQSYGPMALTLTQNNKYISKTVYFYYNIGLVGEAHHLAYESMVQHGYNPENIKMLIKTDLINGNYKIAERYINVLKKTLNYKTFAKKYEKMLLDTTLILSDPELGEKIRLLPKRDFFIRTNDTKNLDMFLETNPENKKAFEYKLARLLLEKDFMAAVNEVAKMKYMGYKTIPRHLEEAILTFIYATRQLPDMAGLTVRSETGDRYTKYNNAIRSNRGDRSLIEKNIKTSEKNTFWYYLQFSFMKSDFYVNSPENNTIY